MKKTPLKISGSRSRSGATPKSNLFIYLFIYLFMCVFVCLFVCLFNTPDGSKQLKYTMNTNHSKRKRQ